MQCYNWFMAAALQRIEEEQFCVFRGICIFQFLKLSLCRMNEHILFRYSSLIISKLARGAKNLKSPLQSRTHRGNILCINMLHWTCSFIWTQVNFLNLTSSAMLNVLGWRYDESATRQCWSFANLAELSLCPGRSWMQQQQQNCTG